MNYLLAVPLAMLSSGVATICAFGYIVGGILLAKDPLWAAVFITLGVIILPLSFYLRNGLRQQKFGRCGEIAYKLAKYTGDLK